MTAVQDQAALTGTLGDHVDHPATCTGQPWDHTAIPYTDDDTIALIGQAARALSARRAPMFHGDAGVTISVLVSLAAEADDQVHDAVADARDQGYTWEQIAERLATSVTTARRRYSAYSAWRRTQPIEND